MATHNQVRVVGYLKNDPVIINEGEDGMEQILFQIRTTRREIDGFTMDKFADVIIYYDSDQLMAKLKVLKKFDIIDIKGVFNIIRNKKPSVCPACGYKNIKDTGTSTFVYPLSISRMGSYAGFYDEKGESPDALLEKNYEEISNQALIIGTVVSEPEMLPMGRTSCCRYELGVDRKYYIKTQDDKKADYPWIYSYGQQAEWDFAHLKKGALILVDGFMHNKKLNAPMVCADCGTNYTFKDVGTQFTPYSIEYFTGHKTDEDIAREAETERRRMLNNVS